MANDRKPKSPGRAACNFSFTLNYIDMSHLSINFLTPSELLCFNQLRDQRSCLLVTMQVLIDQFDNYLISLDHFKLSSNSLLSQIISLSSDMEKILSLGTSRRKSSGTLDFAELY